MDRNTIFKIIFPAILLLLALSYAIGSSKNLTLAINTIKEFTFLSEEPVSNFTFTPDNVCADTQIKFTNLSSGTELSYKWDFGDGSSISTDKDPTHAFITATGGGTKSFTVILAVTDKEGISKSVQKTVTVKEIPSLNVTSDKESTNFENLKYFVLCENQPSDFTFYNGAGGTEKNTLYQIDWGDGSPVFSGANWTELKHTYAVGIYDIIYTVTPENGCKVTKKYGVFIGSNPAVGLGNPGNTNVCAGETLTFPITGTENNPLGTLYKVTFSDGSPVQIFNHPAPASVSHTFTKSSCGINLEQGFPNSFSVKIVAENPCSKSQASVVPIYVSEPPKPLINAPADPVCVDQNVTFENTTIFGSEVSNNGTCSQEGKFVWEISPATGWVIGGGSIGSRPNPTAPNTWISGSDKITPKFTTPGTYTIKLITGNRCGTNEEIKTICVIPKPEPSFTLINTEVCGPATVKTTNTSNILGTCGISDETFTWTVSYFTGTCGTTSDWVFTDGTDKNSESPSFLFKNPGIYTIKLSVSSGCGTFSKEEKATVTSPPTISIAPLANSCGPTTINPKAIVISCVSGTPTYQWTFEGGIPASSTSLDPGFVSFDTPGEKKITLVVTSSCGTTTSVKSFTLSEPPKTFAGMDLGICNGEDFLLNGSATLGSGNYTFMWTSIPTSSISGATTLTPLVKPAITTTYKLTVTDQETNCKSTDEVVVSVIPAPLVVFDSPNQEICSGEQTKLVTITSNPLGETIGWTSEANGIIGLTTVSGTTEIPSQTLTNTTGNPIDVVFTAIITNSSSGNCSVVPSKYIIKVNPEPSYSDDVILTCSDQEINYQPPGLISGSSFIWTVNAPSGITGAFNTSIPQASIKQKLSNDSNAPLDVGYIITPSLGTCLGQPFKLKVTVQPSPSINFSIQDQEICTGSQSQAVALNSEVAGAEFSWTVDSKGVQGFTPSGTGNLIPVQTLINPTTAPIIVEYKVSVGTSAGGSCSGALKIYKITVNPSISLTQNTSGFNGFGISCFGANDGFIKLNPAGGNGVFSFSWTGPDGFSSTNKDISSLSPGDYQVLIKDEFGCSLSQSFNLKEPTALNASVISVTNVLCAGDASGSIQTNIGGGVSSPSYQFAWKRNGIAISTNSQNLTNVLAGNYDLLVTDANGCTTSIPDIQITEPLKALVINYSKTDISCYGANDGSLNLDISGGLPPYDIKWNFGSGQSDFDNLGPGNYTLTVSDKSGCVRTQTIKIEDAPLFKTEPEVQQISCFGEKNGSIKLNLVGGVGANTIKWDHGAELENLFNLESGFYGVTIKDAADCEIRSEFNIIEPALLQLEFSLTDALDCTNPQSGEINLGISGGTPPYSIKWSNGQTSEDLTGITSGQYAVSIEDASGCTINKAFEIKRPAPISIVAFKSTNVQCEPRHVEEEFKITISGGFAPYTIHWSGGKISSDGKTMKTSDPGLYEVSVTDESGCSAVQTFEVENLEIIPEAEIESAAFEQYNSYLVNFEIQFLNKSFGQISSYFWDFGDGSESFEENPKHIYAAEGIYEITLTISDLFGCTAVIKKKISVFDYYLVVPNAFTPNGDGINDTFFPKFINIESLQFWILNKWGETIYFSDEMNNQGWDGKINSEVATPGNYVYRLKFQTLDGRTQTQTDHFILLK